MDPFTCGQPLAPHVGACPPTKLRFIWAATTSGAPNSSNRVHGLDDRSFILVGEVVQCSVVRATTYSSARKEHSVFPLTVMTPRGAMSKINSLLLKLSGELNTTSSTREPVRRASTPGITPLKVVFTLANS